MFLHIELLPFCCCSSPWCCPLYAPAAGAMNAGAGGFGAPGYPAGGGPPGYATGGGGACQYLSASDGGGGAGCAYPSGGGGGGGSRPMVTTLPWRALP
jgi:hypothetical protein